MPTRQTRINCSSPKTTAGTYEYQIGGFTAADIEVYDVSSPMTVTRMINTQVGSGAARLDRHALYCEL